MRRDPQGAIRKKTDDENQGQIMKKKVETVVEEEEAGAEMTEDVDLTKYTPVCLAKVTSTTKFDGKTAKAVGWG